jgi:FtsP/CotA-like multicopper oxidase with cupredoxin domain
MCKYLLIPFALLFSSNLLAVDHHLEVRIQERQVVGGVQTHRYTVGDVIRMNWYTDESTEVHLHGYDIRIQLNDEKPALMVIEANATGRFPVTSHGFGGGHGHSDHHQVLMYLEVLPD